MPAATWPTLSFRIAFSNPGDAPVWTDVTNYLYHRWHGFTISRGRQYELDRFQTGRFQTSLLNDDRRFDPTYRAVANLLSNPSAETNLTGWTSRSSATLTRVSTEHFSGSWSVQVVTPGSAANEGFWNIDGAATVGLPHVASVYLKRASAGSTSLRLAMAWVDSGGTEIAYSSSTISLNSTNWTRFSVVGVAPAAAVRVRLIVDTTGGGGSITFYADAAMIELGGTPGAYQDGSTAGSPYSPFVTPMRRVSLQATYSAVTYDLFGGLILGYQQSWPDGRTQLASIDCSDIFAALARYQLPLATVYPEELSGARVNRLMNTYGPGSQWTGTVDTGASYCQKVYDAWDGKNLLQALQDVEMTEEGRLFVAANGTVRFIGRDAFSQSPYNTSQATLGEASPNLPYEGLAFGLDESRVANRAKVGRLRADDGTVSGTVAAVETPTDQTIDDAASQALYLMRSLERSSMLHRYDVESYAHASFLLNRTAYPASRLPTVTLRPFRDATLWPHALGREIGDLVTVTAAPSAGPTISVAARIEGIEHRVSGGDRGPDWQTTWRLSPNTEPAAAGWTLGTTALGSAVATY